MERNVQEKLANLEFENGKANLEITVEEAKGIQQMVFEIENLKEEMRKLCLSIDEEREEESEIHRLAKEIYIQHLIEIKNEEIN
jgi:hypothetical protein